MISPNRVSASELIDDLLVLEDSMIDDGKKARYLLIFKRLWKRENMSGLKDSVRTIIDVQKGQNRIILPKESFMFSTVSVLDKGKFVPLLINSNLSQDTVDLSANKVCPCGCGSDLCAAVRNYELIQKKVSAKMPDSSFQTFTMTVKKKVNLDGSYIREITEPIAVFTNNIHTSTELQTREEYMCNLEVNEDGCVKECDDNHKKVWGNCQFNTIWNDCGKPIDLSECHPKIREYNISDDGESIILPSHFSYDKVVVRTYQTLPTKEIMIPFVCQDYIMASLVEEINKFDKKIQRYIKLDDKKRKDDYKEEMMINLSRMTISEIYDAIVGKNRIK